MKNIIFAIILILFCIVKGYPQQSTVHISGDFPKFRNSPVPYSFSLSFDGARVLEADRIMENGKFDIALDIDKPHFLVVKIDEKLLFSAGSGAGIIVFPDDSIKLLIEDFGINNITATGRGSGRLTLEKSYRITIQANKSTHLLKSAIEKMERANVLAETLESLIPDFHEELTEAEKQTILANKYVSIYSLPIYNMLKKEYDVQDIQFMTDNVIENKRLKYLLSLSNEERKMLNLGNSYHNLLKEYAYIKQSLINKSTYTPGQSIKDDYFTLNAIYEGFKIRDYVLSNFIVRTSYRKGLNDGLDECYAHFFSNVASDDPLYADVEVSYNRLNTNLAQGATPPNFLLTDSLGNSVRLQDLSEKVVVLDFWFNGCGGCAQITPGLEDVKKTFGEREDLIFVSVSIDKQRESWLRGIGKFTPAKAMHLYTNGDGTDSPIIKHFNIKVYPTLMILGKNGKISKARASKPYSNNDEAKTQLIREIKSALSI